MADSLVHRATSDQLIGPDWAMNMEICDILNRDPGQAKDAVKALKKRIAHKSPKVQLLALTLLETIVKNCGDIVHMHVAERDLPHEMVKLSRKKCDPHVKEKVLILIDTWQEAFGGPRARYPQYFSAYHELLRAGAVFPQKAERSAPYFNPQVLPAGTYPASSRSPDFQREEAESAGTEPAALTFSEIQNARGIMDVLAEMLSALDPANREGVRQEVIVDLVSQCRNYKQRVVHLVNSTADEELLSQGLTLNDDLQRVLGKHDAIAAGIPFREDNSNKGKDKEKEKEAEKPKQNSLQQLVDIEDGTTSNRDSTNDQDRVSGASTGDNPPFQQLLLTGPEGSNGPAAATSSKPEPTMDLLSFDVDTPEPAPANGSLALVPVTDPFSASNSNSNAASNPGDLLALVEMYPQTNSVPTTDSSANLMGSQPFGINGVQPPVQPQQQLPTHSGIYANGAAIPNSMANHVATPPDQASPQFNQPALPWNGQMVQQGMSPRSPTAEFVDNQGEAFPLPPWETQLDQSSQTTAVQPGGVQMTTLAGPTMQPQSPMQMTTLAGPTMQPQSPMQMGQMPMQNGQPGFLPQQQLVQGAQFPGMQYQQGPASQYGPPGQYGMYPQQMAMYGGQMMGYGYMQPAQDASQYYGQMGQMYGYGAGMGSANDLSQRMYGLSVQDKTGGYASGAGSGLSYSNSAPMVPSSRPAKPEDKLFGDLVSFAKSKPK